VTTIRSHDGASRIRHLRRIDVGADVAGDQPPADRLVQRPMQRPVHVPDRARRKGAFTIAAAIDSEPVVQLLDGKRRELLELHAAEPGDDVAAQ
jgi:hypothetical protein